MNKSVLKLVLVATSWLAGSLVLAAGAWADSELLAQLSARSKTVASLDGRFDQQKTIAVLPMPINSSGVFHFAQGEGVIWETRVPVQTQVKLSPGGISFDDQPAPAGSNQATAIVAKIFMGVIAGELSSLNDYFSIQTLGDANHWQLILTPRSDNLKAYIQNIEVRGEEFTEQLAIDETNGDKTLIKFSVDKVVRTQP